MESGSVLSVAPAFLTRRCFFLARAIKHGSSVSRQQMYWPVLKSKRSSSPQLVKRRHPFVPAGRASSSSVRFQRNSGRGEKRRSEVGRAEAHPSDNEWQKNIRILPCCCFLFPSVSSPKAFGVKNLLAS